MQIDRRHFLSFQSAGLMSAALLSLLPKHALADSQKSLEPHFPPKAKRAIHICLVGGYSQVDSFDYKPALEQLHGKSIPGDTKPDTFFGSAGLLHQSHWKFRQRGESGLWISDLFPHLAEVADRLTFVYSMSSDTANHTPATFQQLTGFQANGFPSLGSWISYGLGGESDSLPTFVVLPDGRSLPSGGPANWSSGFLPAEHQGTILRSGSEPIRDLFSKQPIGAEKEKTALAFLNRINREHQTARTEHELLAARISSYELAAKMQVSIPESLKFTDESAETLEAYGLNEVETRDCGQRCLLARRLLERGVRFIQLFSGGCFGGAPRHGWDSHEDCKVDHSREARLIDKPIAHFIRDLASRGMLEDTLVIFTTEFGRTPFANSPAGVLGLGRDHNPEGFTVWLAGAGLKPGFGFGATDEIGWKASENRLTWPDLHATILHLLGFDHEKLTFYHNGIERRLTNVHGRVVRELLA